MARQICNFNSFGQRLNFGLGQSWRLALIAAIGLSWLTACESTIHTDGQILDADKLATIQPGVQTKAQVEKMIGSPSTQSTYGATIWYYISKRTSQFAFFDPDTEEQKVVEIGFDDSGKVSDVKQYSLADAENVTPVGRTTPTKGKSLSFLDQMIGNMNRYGASAGSRGEGGQAPSGGGGVGN
ncbi:MAG: outer membrane protein assembly factor BamE [Alphaproteobacteria bacterium]